jgi:hypothetical protein
MKKFLIPNSQYFCARPIGTNHISSIFGIEKKIHDTFNISEPTISRANKYLLRQEKRLVKQAKAKDYLRFNIVAEVLFKRSDSFQVACFNHKYPQWYWKSKSSVMKVYRL